MKHITNPFICSPFRKQAALNNFTQTIAKYTHGFHHTFPRSAATPLHRMKGLASQLKVRNIFIKDESNRLGLKSFKVLGATFAIARFLAHRWGIPPRKIECGVLTKKATGSNQESLTFTTASDGNHGRGVAWAARELGFPAKVFLPKGTADSRIKAISSFGALVEVTDVNYDDSVRMAREAASRNNWILVQDTALGDYFQIPLWIMQGYLTMIHEAMELLFKRGNTPISHVFLQTGVGSLAASVLGYLVNRMGEQYPRAIILEPHQAACYFESLKIGDGKSHPARGNLDTVMAGLSCGEANPLAWEILKSYAHNAISCSDRLALQGMRRLANPTNSDPNIVSGESGAAVSVGVLNEIMTNSKFKDLRKDLKLNRQSSILLINTEGDTDPTMYRKITEA